MLPPESECEEQNPALEEEPELQHYVITRYDTNGDDEIVFAEYNAAIPDLGTTLRVANLINPRATYLTSSR